MTPGPTPPAELQPLLDALCEATITPDQLRRLEEIVLSDPAAEAYYVQYMSFYADLIWHFAGPADRRGRPAAGVGLRQPVAGPPRPAAPGGDSPRPRSRRFRPPTRWGVGLAGLAAGLLLAVGLWPRVEPAVRHRPDPPAERTDETVAVLLHSHRAEWDETGLPTHPGAPLAPGRLVLKSGFAQIEFYCGATVILEGPAELRIVSRTQAFCAAGKLRATVPAQAQGFTITSPALDLVDRGTEFGLRVVGQKTEVHVFRGKVDVYDHAVGPKAAPRKELTTGQGVTQDGAGAMNAIAPNPGGFLTAGELADRAAEEALRRQREWAEASATTRQDPTLLVYYTFRSGPAWERTLVNEAGAPGRPPDGAIVGCSWGAGRWPGKQGLEFKRVSDRVRFHVPGEFDSLTLAAWVRPDALPNSNNSLMMTDGWEPGELHWQIGADGTLILGIQGPPEFQMPPNLRGAHYHAPGLITPDRFGRWAHLAVVYDRDAGQVTHYLDGRPVATESAWFDAPLRVGDAELGNWNVAGYRNKTPVRNFNGCIDEFLLFSRALTGEDVGRLYARGRPGS